MARVVDVVMLAALLVVTPVVSGAQSATTRAEPVTITATITAIDQATRIITFKGSDGMFAAIKAPDQMEGFKTLKVGDLVTATYYEAMAVQVRKPGNPAPAAAPPVTTTQREEDKPGSLTRRTQTFSVSVQGIDTAGQSITVKGPQGNVVTMKVRDPKQLQNVKVGDMLDVTYYESLLVKVASAPKP